MTSHLIGVDVGGTRIRVGLFDPDLRLSDRESAATGVGAAVLVSCLERLLARHPGVEVAGCGIGVPEYVHNGRVTSALVIDSAATMAAAAHSILGVPVEIESDVRCGAIAESRVVSSADSLLYVSWGTGIASTLVLPGGQVWAGSRGQALSLGDWPGTSGTLEQSCSGVAIPGRFVAAGGASSVDTIDVVRRSTDGDTVAARVLQDAGHELGVAIRQLVDVLDPHHVVLGGGLGCANTVARDALVAEVEKSDEPGRVRVRPPRWGVDSGLVGAATVAFSERR